MPKPTIRSEMLARRRNLPAGICLALSLHIQERVLLLPEFEAASTVGLYSPFRNEVCTELIFRRAREAGKRVAYPRVQGTTQEFVEVADLAELQSGAFGILEPVGSRRVGVEEIDLMIVPGVAFDLEGFRLGYGKGYYDRVLHGSRRRTCLVGLCYEAQIVPAVPAEDHDIRMDLVVTEARTIRCGRTPARASLITF